jgi:hypothetical protein
MHVTGKQPEKVALIGCGPSMQDYVNLMASHQCHGLNVDEVWGINFAGQPLRIDVSFAMDDYREVAGNDQDYFKRFYQSADHPIITSNPHPDCPTAVRYPLAEVLNAVGNPRPYFNHTAAYAIAYAIMIGVKEICVFGCDYIAWDKPYARPDIVPRYMSCMSYWCGQAEARGVTVIVTPNSALLDSNLGAGDRFYGYLIKPIIKEIDNG